MLNKLYNSVFGKQLSREARNHFAWMSELIAVILIIVVLSRMYRESTVQLREASARTEAVQALLDSEDYGIAIFDANGKIVAWNPALMRMTHWTETDIKEKGLEIVMSQDVIIKLRKVVAKEMGSEKIEGDVVVLECELKQKDDGLLPVRMTIRTVESESGIRYSSVHIDKQSTIKRITVQ